MGSPSPSRPPNEVDPNAATVVTAGGTARDLVTLDYVPANPGEPADVVGGLLAAFGDRFELGKPLGQGGFGSVYEALDRRLGRRVAIKVTPTHTDDQEALLREARALAQLRHPGIVAVFDVAVVGGHGFVVSELLPGPSLDDWTKEDPPVAEIARVTADVADALAHAHARGIVHRDLKPANIVFAAGRRPVLVDFGLALLDQDAASERGQVAGTPAFMSPEQAVGRAHRPDGRTDVYGLAATLYALLVGRPPFHGVTPLDVLRQVEEDAPRPPRELRPDLPPALEAVCLKGLAKLPGDRFATAADFADAIRRAVGMVPATPDLVRGPRTERRQVTLVQFAFAPQVAEDDDPTEQVLAFRAACQTAVAAHGGLTLPTTGTEFLACFGYPTAHDDTPRQAVRAALAVCEAVPGLTAAVGTGAAVVAETAAALTVIGDVTGSVAATAAGGGAGVTITDGAFRLVGGYFDTFPAGTVRPRGAPQPTPVYHVTAERAARSRMDALDPARLSPLVGRDRELALLRDGWQRAADGRQHVILLVADPGLGKSRLVRSLKDFALAGGGTAVECYCSPHHAGSPFYPIIDYFERTYQLGREADPARRLDTLLARLRADGVHDPEELALFAAMLSVPTLGRLPAVTLSPDRQKERTVDAVLAWLAARSATAPVLFVVEDLHWVDPSTEGLLAGFVEEAADAGVLGVFGSGATAGRVLGVFTARPEYDPPWKGTIARPPVALNRLTRDEVGELIRAQGGAAVPAAAAEQIAARTDGVPLFVEEFTRLVADGGPAGLDTAIPASLHDLLLARLDRMASDREVVQLGATIGRTFGYELIRTATDRDEAVLRAELRKLVAAGLLFPQGTAAETTYTFKHALIQDAAYQSLVKKTRQRLHGRVAAALATAFPAVVETQPELLAHHLTEASETARAIEFWRKAGERARQRSAHLEAIRHLTRGLGLLAGRPAAADRDADELPFRMSLSASFIAVRGYAAPEVEEHIQRARELCERLGPSSPLFHVMMIIWALRFIRGQSAAAIQTSREIFALADGLDGSYKAEAYWSRTASEWWAGAFASSLDLARRGVAVYRLGPSLPHAVVLQQNCGPLMTCYVGWAYWMLGFPDQARDWVARALALAEELGDKFSLVVTRWQAGFLTAIAGRTAETRAFADQVIATAAEESYAFWLALGLGLRGVALAQDGRPAEAVPLLRDAVAGCDAIGAGILHTYFLGELAEALWRADCRAEAETVLDRAFAHNDRLGQRAFEAELKRRRGEFAQSEPALRDALAVARGQQARMFELRAAAALARLGVADGRELVAELVAGFTEGADAPDLVAARSFLNGV